MATIEELENGLRKAHAAGNADHARTFANEIRRLRSEQHDWSNVQGGSSTVAHTPQPTRLGQEKRGVGLSARSAAQGVGSLVGALGGDAFNAYVANPIERLVTGRDVPYQSMRDIAGGWADRAGLPQPQNASERIRGDVGEALTGTGLTMGVGGALNTGRALMPTVQNRLAQFLTAQPGLQTVSTATGSGAASATREGGGSQGQQLAAGLIGGLAPGAASATTAATTRGVVRGTSGDTMQRNIADFNALGANPSVGQATQRPLVQGLENLLAGGPTSAGVMNRFATQQADDIGAGLQRQAQTLSPVSGGEDAGRAILRGITGDKGFTANFKATQEQLFDRLDNFIPAQQPIALTNTQQALGQLNAPIAGAPNVSKLFQNARIAGIGRALDNDLAIPTEAQKQLDGALAQIDSLYASRNAAVQEMGRFRAFANDQANRTHQWYPVEGQPRIAGRYSHFPERAAEGMEAAGEAGQAAMSSLSRARQIESTLEQLQGAVAATNGRLPYEAIKKLRTLVGQELNDAGLMSDFPRSKFKALYAALSKDLGQAATEAGPEAAFSYRLANEYTRKGMRHMEMMEHVIDKNGGPEAVFNAAMQGTRDGATTLRAVMSALPRDGQRAVTAAVIRRMGMATPRQQDLSGELFSARSFLTNWSRVSPEAKRALFDRHGPGFSRDMDRIARVADNVDMGSQVFKNSSGTANRHAAQSYAIGLPISVAQAPFTGHYWPIALTVGGGIAANVAARAMTNPAAVRWLARTTTMPRGAIPAALHSMRAAGERDGDQDLVELANALLEQQPESTPSQ